MSTNTNSEALFAVFAKELHNLLDAVAGIHASDKFKESLTVDAEACAILANKALVADSVDTLAHLCEYARDVNERLAKEFL